MYLCRELLCNLWWWPLNLLRSWLVCKLVWNLSWFHGLPGYTGLSLLNRLLGGWFSHLISYNWSVLLHPVCKMRLWNLSVLHQTLGLQCPVQHCATSGVWFYARAICWPDAGWASCALHLRVWCAVFGRGVIQVTVMIERTRFKRWYVAAI
jgi:hypothetical protein